MAIAPSKLGQFVRREESNDRLLIAHLREAGLVRAEVSDSQLLGTFKRAQDEDAALSEDDRAFNSPHERVRVFLGPYLTEKGKKWAVPLESLDLPD